MNNSTKRILGLTLALFVVAGIFLIAALGKNIAAPPGGAVASQDETIAPLNADTVEAPGTPPTPTLESSAIDPLSAFRKLFFSAHGNASRSRNDDALRTVYVERDPSQHREPDYSTDDDEEEGDGDDSDESQAPIQDPPELLDERKLEMEVIADGDMRDVTLTAQLVYQSEHANIWLPDDAEYHQESKSTHDDDTCKLQLIKKSLNASQKIPEIVAERFDEIYQRMSANFGPHIKVDISESDDKPSFTGDLDEDEHVNLIIHNTGGSLGFFTASDLWQNALDMIHLNDVLLYNGLTGNDQDDNLDVYSTVAHEYQHMLFNTYFAIYIPDDKYMLFSWYDESLAELAGGFYSAADTQTIPTYAYMQAAQNSYGDDNDGYTDFLNHEAAKNYSMETLFSATLNQKLNGAYASGVYSYFKKIPGDSFVEKRSYVMGKSMVELVGGALKTALGADYEGYSDSEILSNVYYMFMERFAAEGGSYLNYEDNLLLYYPLFEGDDAPAEKQLWEMRQSLEDEDAIPTLEQGESIVLSGYSGTTPEGASHDMLYYLGQNATNDILKINIPGNPGTRYYLAVLYPGEMGGTLLLYLPPDMPLEFSTGGAETYLFVSTLYSNVNVKPTFTWESNPSTMTPE